MFERLKIIVQLIPVIASKFLKPIPMIWQKTSVDIKLELSIFLVCQTKIIIEILTPLSILSDLFNPLSASSKSHESYRCKLPVIYFLNTTNSRQSSIEVVVNYPI